MNDKYELKTIAIIHSDFPTKFGIPRQSGLTSLMSRIVFEPEYRDQTAIRGLEQFSHIWIIWGFSQSDNNNRSLTVRPPKLGGNKRMGVFATRSPFRPNALGLSSVKLERIETTEKGPALIVTGADLSDGTPIFDIKPYIPYSDCHPDATGGFSVDGNNKLDVVFAPNLLDLIDKEKQNGLVDILAQDPRPSYHNDPDRIYGFPFADFEIKFSVKDKTLTVVSVEKI